MNYYYHFSWACSIEFDDKVVVTGGHYTERRVSVYNIGGWVEDLPELNEGRRNHGCGYYVDNSDRIVGFYIVLDLITINKLSI